MLRNIPALWLLLSLVVLALSAVGIRRAFAGSLDTMALTLNALAALLVSPVSWSHHWVCFLPLSRMALAPIRNARSRLSSSADLLPLYY